MSQHDIELKCQHPEYKSIMLITATTIVSVFLIIIFQLGPVFLISIALISIIFTLLFSRCVIVSGEKEVYLKRVLTNKKVDLSGSVRMVLTYFAFTSANGHQFTLIDSNGNKRKITFTPTQSNALKLESIIRAINKNGSAIIFESDTKKGYYSGIKKKLGIKTRHIKPKYFL